MAVGLPVTYSSASPNHSNYRLDYSGPGYQGWKSGVKKMGEWIQVSHQDPKIWSRLIIQGRKDCDEWVKEVQIAYSVNGRYWDYVE